MKIENLITFRRVADERSYTRAADGLFLTPSAVYQQVKQLEAEVGAKLVYVVGKEVQLTTEGRLVYESAQEIEGVHTTLVSQIAAMHDRSQHVVRIGASSYFGIMAGAADSLTKRQTDLSVEFETMRPWDAIDQLRAGAIDFGFVGAMHLQPDLIAEPCVENRIVIVVPTEHPLAGMGAVTFETVQQYSMVGYQDGSARRAIDRWATSRSNVRITYAAQMISSVDIKTTAGLMGLPAFVVQSAVEREVASGTLCVVNVTDFDAAYVLFVVYRREPSSAAAEYLTEIRALRGSNLDLHPSRISSDLVEP